MKFKNIKVGDKVVHKKSLFVVTVSDLNYEAQTFNGVVIHVEEGSPFELGDFSYDFAPKYFRKVTEH